MTNNTFNLVWIASVMAMAASGCAPQRAAEAATPEAAPQAEPRSAGPVAKARVDFDQQDLSSNLGDTALTLTVVNGGTEVDPALLDAIAANARIELEPEGTLLPVDIEIVYGKLPPLPVNVEHKGGRRTEPEVAWTADRARSKIILRPRARLAQRWHRLVLSALPEGVAPITGSGKPFGRGFKARFNPGSAPVLRRVTLCERGEGRVAAVAEYSEEIIASQASSGIEIDQPESGARCKLVASDSDLRANPRKDVDYECNDFTRQGNMRLAFRNDILARTGVRVNLASGAGRADRTARFEGLARTADGCAVWEP